MSIDSEIKEAKDFCTSLYRQAQRKATFYDGSNRDLAVDTSLRYATEELGEVASEISRERWLQAEAECIDLAHTAFLIWKSLRKIRSNK